MTTSSLRYVLLVSSIAVFSAACGSVAPVNPPDGGVNPDGSACPDADVDGTCDADDVCPGSDDGIDADNDGIPDGCDVCEGSDDGIDADDDGTPDGCDLCEGSDDGIDADNDGTPDDCDVCEGSDDNIDTDNDGIPDDCDVCEGSDDNIDDDNNGIPDGCQCESFDVADTTTIPGWTEQAGDFFIDANRLMTTATTGAYSNHITLDVSTQDDACATADMEYGAGATVRAQGIVLRWNPPADYVVALIQDNSGAGDFNSMWIYEYPAGVGIASNPSAGSLGTNPIINADVVGNTVTLRVDVDRDGTWDQMLSGDTTKTEPGLTGYMGISFGEPGFVDNFCWGACN